MATQIKKAHDAVTSQATGKAISTQIVLPFLYLNIHFKYSEH